MGRSWCIDCCQTAYGVLEDDVLTVCDLEGNAVARAGEETGAADVSMSTAGRLPVIGSDH